MTSFWMVRLLVGTAAATGVGIALGLMDASLASLLRFYQLRQRPGSVSRDA